MQLTEIIVLSATALVLAGMFLRTALVLVREERQTREAQAKIREDRLLRVEEGLQEVTDRLNKAEIKRFVR